MSNLSWFAGETQLAAELNNLGWVNSKTVIVSREASHSSEQLFLDIIFRWLHTTELEKSVENFAPYLVNYLLRMKLHGVTHDIGLLAWPQGPQYRLQRGDIPEEGLNSASK